ncbi:hypothetical protein, partial [Methyloglobulus morosus]|uniref:hypothetical protein n=1 Tax=Methyloglobulus morosus TaxID=1410681 RepID=UPI00055FF4C9
MISWLKDFISPNSSAKTIAIVLLTCVNLVIFWDKGEKLIASRGVQDYYASFILIVIFYSVSHLLIIILCKLFASLEKIWAYYKESQHKKAGLKAFRHKVRKAIPQLPTAQIEILGQLSESERTLDLVKNGALYLENQNYITRLHKVSHSSFVFEI